MMSKISIMQGRLSSPFEGRFQAFPASTWQEEFGAAQKLGLYSIEWIYEEPHSQNNPLTTSSGIHEIQKLITTTNVHVKSICADYYMTKNLIQDGKALKENWEHLEWLLQQGKKLGITYLILPFVDSSSLKNFEEQEILSEQLKILLTHSEKTGVEIHLETDLPPLSFLKTFEKVAHPLLKLNYDTGNSASLGYDVDEELKLMGKYLGSVHIKDRLMGGGTVPLGSGNTNLNQCVYWFKKLNFNRWYVLQAARRKPGQESENTHHQMTFLKNLIADKK